MITLWWSFKMRKKNCSISHCQFRRIFLKRFINQKKYNIPTAGDIDLEPELPVGDGVGRIAIEFGVFGVVPTAAFELSLLF